MISIHIYVKVLSNSSITFIETVTSLQTEHSITTRKYVLQKKEYRDRKLKKNRPIDHKCLYEFKHVEFSKQIIK